jgi:hypothetical protein
MPTSRKTRLASNKYHGNIHKRGEEKARRAEEGGDSDQSKGIKWVAVAILVFVVVSSVFHIYAGKRPL